MREPAVSLPIVTHPRGRIAPPLPKEAPRVQRSVRVVERLGHGLVLHEAFLAAPAMAFHFFLSLLPLLVFVGYVVGALVRTHGVEVTLEPLLGNLPEESEAVVRSELERLGGASTLGPLGAIGFLYLASGGTHGLMDALETVVGAPRRAWWRQRLIALGCVLLTLFSLVFAAWAVIGWDEVVHAQDEESEVAVPPTASASAAPPQAASVRPPSGVRGTTREITKPRSTTKTRTGVTVVRRRTMRILRSGGERALAAAISLAAIAAGLALFYRVAVSHSKKVKRRVWPGALLAVALWVVISWAFGVYARSLATYAVYYGSLTAVAVTLLWLWLTSLTILVGAELNAQLEGLRD